jgi:Xaa-Pro aminopeptidase
VTETLIRPLSETGEIGAPVNADRLADIDGKLQRIAPLLQDVGCDGLLLLEPENVAWLTSGAVLRGLFDAASTPAVYCSGDSRWILASNVDSPRMFDEEVDNLGFQLKEWPWHWGRDQLIADLCQNRKVACDRDVPETKPVGNAIARMRRQLTTYEQACLRVIGQITAHALEATCRNISKGDSEREAAGQLAHRLIHRGAQPVQIGVAADDRSRVYRRHGFTATAIKQYAVLTASARKYGLTVTATRSVSFGAPPSEFVQGHNGVCRVTASYLASTWPDAVPREILLAGRRIYLISGFEHEWLLAPQGHVTGRVPIELPFTPRCEELFEPGWAITWSASAGAAISCDTFVITDQGPKAMTPAEVWPMKRIRIQGAEFTRPDILER